MRKRWIAACVLGLACLLPPHFAQAQTVFEQPGTVTKSTFTQKFEFGFQGGFFMPEGNTNLDPGATFGLHIGYQPCSWVGMEVGGSYGMLSPSEGGGDVRLGVIRGDALLHFVRDPEAQWDPFALVGGGWARWSPDSGLPNNDGFFEYGAGVNYFALECLAVRFDARGLLLYDPHYSNGNANALEASLGVAWHRKVKKALPPPDEDGDGVPDAKDQCPGTKFNIPVDELGCATDADGDGIPNGLDECPDTPEGTPVDYRGCPAE